MDTSIMSHSTYQHSQNKPVVHSVEKVFSAQSPMKDMAQQYMHLVTSVSNVTGADPGFDKEGGPDRCCT